MHLATAALIEKIMGGKNSVRKIQRLCENAIERPGNDRIHGRTDTASSRNKSRRR